LKDAELLNNVQYSVVDRNSYYELYSFAVNNSERVGYNVYKRLFNYTALNVQDRPRDVNSLPFLSINASLTEDKVFTTKNFTMRALESSYFASTFFTTLTLKEFNRSLQGNLRKY